MAQVWQTTEHVNTGIIEGTELGQVGIASGCLAFEYGAPMRIAPAGGFSDGGREDVVIKPIPPFLRGLGC